MADSKSTQSVASVCRDRIVICHDSFVIGIVFDSYVKMTLVYFSTWYWPLIRDCCALSRTRTSFSAIFDFEKSNFSLIFLCQINFHLRFCLRFWRLCFIFHSSLLVTKANGSVPRDVNTALIAISEIWHVLISVTLNVSDNGLSRLSSLFWKSWTAFSNRFSEFSTWNFKNFEMVFRNFQTLILEISKIWKILTTRFQFLINYLLTEITKQCTSIIFILIQNPFYIEKQALDPNKYFMPIQF